MTNIDQIRENFPNYEFIIASDSIFVRYNNCDILYVDVLSIDIHNNINLLLANCEEFNFINNELIFKFPKFTIITNLYTIGVKDGYNHSEPKYLDSLDDFMKDYLVIYNTGKILSKKYYNYKININSDLRFVFTFNDIVLYDNIELPPIVIHDNIITLKEFLDANSEFNEPDAGYDSTVLLYKLNNYSIYIGLDGYYINNKNRYRKFTTSAQEVIDYVKENSPELFMNKLATIS